MKTPTILTSLVLTLAGLPLLSCSGQPETAAAPNSPTKTEEPLFSPEEVAIPSQEEADKAAAKSIDEANADAELEKLEKELEGGGG